MLKFASSDMLEVFITSTAELPGLIVAALLVDTLGRKGCMLFLLFLYFFSLALFCLRACIAVTVHYSCITAVSGGQFAYKNYCCSACLKIVLDILPLLAD